MEKPFFDQTIKNNKVTYENIKVATVKEMIIQLVVC